MSAGHSSVSRRLVASVALPLILFFALTIMVLDRLYRGAVEQALNQRLDEQYIALITAADVGEQGQMGVRLLDPESRWNTPVSGFYAEVRDADGALLWQSPSLAGTGLALGSAPQAGVAQRARVHSAQGEEVAVLSRALSWEYPSGENVLTAFTVAESTGPLQQQMWSFRQQVLGWFTLMAVALLAVLGWLLRRALAPVRQLQAEINDIEVGRREQLSPHYPRELAGVADSLNALLLAERARIKRYRETLGNLAHSLKTPLAVMRAALRHEADPKAPLDAEIDRISELVDHQLRRAAGGGAATLGQKLVPVAAVVDGLVRALQKVHAAIAPRFELQVDERAGFAGSAEDLTETLGNLLDNACKYGRGQVLLRARIDSTLPAPLQLVMQVCDNGAGIPPEQRLSVLARGVRHDERQPGHGLGLAMVGDTARIYGGHLHVGENSELGGACFELVLPGRYIAAGA